MILMIHNNKLDLNIDNTYDIVNDDSNITDFRENNIFNSEAVPSSSKSRGRRQRRSRGHGHPRTKTLEEINKPKLKKTETLCTSIMHA
jgi:hypothetical protein